MDREALRAEWLQAVGGLIDQITEWTQEKGWTLSQHPRQISEEELGSYVVPDVTIATPHGQLRLEVKPRGDAEAAGRVELLAWPTLYRVLLLHRRGQPDWTIRTDSGIALRQPWTKDTFLTLTEDLLAAA